MSKVSMMLNTTHFHCESDRIRVMSILDRLGLLITANSITKSKGSLVIKPLRHFDVNKAIETMKSYKKKQHKSRPKWYNYDGVLDILNSILDDINKYRANNLPIPDSSDVWQIEIKNIPLPDFSDVSEGRLLRLDDRNKKRSSFRKKYHGLSKSCSVDIKIIKKDSV